MAAGPFTITAKAGRPVFGCEMKIVDDEGNDLPQDGSVSGNMVVRGPWIVKGYMKGDGKNQFGNAFGTMIEVINNSTQYMTDNDRLSVGVYLKSLKPQRDGLKAAYAYDGSTAAACEVMLEKK